MFLINLRWQFVSTNNYWGSDNVAAGRHEQIQWCSDLRMSLESRGKSQLLFLCKGAVDTAGSFVSMYFRVSYISFHSYEAIIARNNIYLRVLVEFNKHAYYREWLSWLSSH